MRRVSMLQVELGLVWVWPESTPEAWLENFVRDFPVAFDILFENISDQVGSSLKHLAVRMWLS